MQATVRKEGPSSHLPTSPWQLLPIHMDTLYAEARERYIGRSTGYYQIDITNQQNELIATFESSVFRKDQQVPFTLK